MWVCRWPSSSVDSTTQWATTIAPTRVSELRAGNDRTRETDADSIRRATGLSYQLTRLTGWPSAPSLASPIADAGRRRQPDLSPLLLASRTVGRLLKRGDTVIYRSTVYPGRPPKKVCVPVLEEESGLTFNIRLLLRLQSRADQPRRPQAPARGHHREGHLGVDAEDRRLRRCALRFDRERRHALKTSSIRVAEAAKVIENTQRDLNIALMNELAMIFNRLGIDSLEVLEAAGSRSLPAVHAGPGRRPLHRRRSLLPDLQGAGDRVPRPNDPGRTADQRRHGRLCGRPSAAPDGAPSLNPVGARCWCSGSRSRKTAPTYATPRGRYRARISRIRHDGGYPRSMGGCGGRPSRVRPRPGR